MNYLKTYFTGLCFAALTGTVAAACTGQQMIDGILASNDVGYSYIERCLSSGSDPNAKDANGDTALAYAAIMRNGAATVTLLLRAGADPNLPNNRRMTPLFATIQGSCEFEAGNLMIDAGARLSANDPSLIEMASSFGSMVCGRSDEAKQYLERLLKTSG